MPQTRVITLFEKAVHMRVGLQTCSIPRSRGAYAIGGLIVRSFQRAGVGDDHRLPGTTRVTIRALSNGREAVYEIVGQKRHTSTFLSELGQAALDALDADAKVSADMKKQEPPELHELEPWQMM